MSVKATIAGEVSAGCNTVDWERGRTDSEEVADAILSALRSAGWAVVPVEPTEGMVADGALQALTTERHAQRVWEVMLKAAQEDSRE